jgi:hypothetical protein
MKMGLDVRESKAVGKSILMRKHSPAPIICMWLRKSDVSGCMYLVISVGSKGLLTCNPKAITRPD